MPEVHLFIIWEKARAIQEKILDDMAKHFTIIKKFEITWTKKLVPLNYRRFCGTRLGNELDTKIDQCGKGEFLLCVVRDENPIYEARDTFHGRELVNVKMFEAKYRYRNWSELSIGVHATDNERETNHDLTLLLGKNVEDFIKSSPSSETEKLRRDLEGTYGWNSIQQLFYVLTNTVRYAVMRGYGELTTGDFIDHGDTDIMTDDYENLLLIVSNTTTTTTAGIRKKIRVPIGEEAYLLDIWDCGKDGKNYFDPIWVEKMLSEAIEWKGMKILNPENDFYCLLYHCLTNKGYIADDYLKKLQRCKQEFKITEIDWNKILINFLKKNQYEVIRPKDTDNPFNLTNPDIAEYAFRNGGICVFSNENQKIYDNGDALILKEGDEIIKIGRDVLRDILEPVLPEETIHRFSIKKLYKAIVPKRIQKLISKVRKHLR